MSDKPALSTSGQEIAQPRPIDGKFGFLGQKIVNLVSGQEIPEDEPLLLLRARDHHAVSLLKHYARLCEEDCNDLHQAGISELVRKFQNFATSNPERMKQPGITRHLKLEAHSPAVQALESQPQDAKQWLAENFALNEKGQILTDYDAVEGNWLVDKTSKLWRVSEILEAYHAYSRRAESLSKSKAQEE